MKKILCSTILLMHFFFHGFAQAQVISGGVSFVKLETDAETQAKFEKKCEAGIGLSNCVKQSVPNGCPAGQKWSNVGTVISHCVAVDPICNSGTVLKHDARGNPSCVTPPPPPTCSNGALNYPQCNIFPSCANGAINYPVCSTFPSCVNGATNYPACNIFPTPPVCPAPDGPLISEFPNWDSMVDCTYDVTNYTIQNNVCVANPPERTVATVTGWCAYTYRKVFN